MPYAVLRTMLDVDGARYFVTGEVWAQRRGALEVYLFDRTLPNDPATPASQSEWARGARSARPLNEALDWFEGEGWTLLTHSQSDHPWTWSPQSLGFETYVFFRSKVLEPACHDEGTKKHGDKLLKP